MTDFRYSEGDRVDVRAAIADEICSRVDPMWATREPRSLDEYT